MAMTATISMSPSSGYINQKMNGSLTISNSGGSSVLVTSIQPQTKLTGSPSIDINTGVAVSLPPLGQGQNITVPASGSLVFPISFVFFGPSTGPIGAGSGTFDCGAVCQSSDGSIFSPTPATVTINPLPLPVTEQ